MKEKTQYSEYSDATHNAAKVSRFNRSSDFMGEPTVGEL